MREYDWPVQGPPTSVDWVTWRQSLSQAFGVHSHTLRLAQCLGCWITSEQHWRCFVSHSDNRLYEKRDDGWFFHLWCGGRSARTGIFQYQCPALPVPDNATLPALMRTTVERWGNQLVSTGVSPSMPVLMDPVPPGSLAARVAALPDSAAWAMRDAV